MGSHQLFVESISPGLTFNIALLIVRTRAVNWHFDLLVTAEAAT